MSLSVKPVPSYVCIDPLINLHDNYEYIISKSGKQNTYIVLPAVSVSQSSVVFAQLPPSLTTFMSRNFMVRYIIDFAISGVNATPGTNIAQIGSNDSLKFMPLNSKLFNTVTLQLNNTSVAINSADVMQALLRSNIGEEIRESDWSLSPSSIYDMTQNYEDLLNPANPYNAQYSLNMNPSGPVGQGKWDGRGGFRWISRTKIDDDNEIIRYEITEPLIISPLTYKLSEDQQGFIGLNNVTINIVHNQTALAGSMWSHSNYGNVLNSVNATIVSAQLLLRQVTPPVTMILPRGPVLYPYFEVNRYITDLNVINADSTLSGAQSNNIQLNCIPTKMYIYAKRINSSETFNTTDTFAYLNNISITLSNRNGILSGATPQQLYEMSVKNGLKDVSFTQWSRDLGSVLILDPVSDFALDDDLTSGVLTQTQFQIRLDVTNLNLTHNIQFQLFVIVVNPGIFTIDTSNSSAYSQIGVVSKSDVINSSALPNVDYHAVKTIYGGDFASNIKDFGRHVYKTAQQVAPIVRKALPYAAKALEYAPAALSLVGLGEEEMEGEGRRRRRRRKH